MFQEFACQKLVSWFQFQYPKVAVHIHNMIFPRNIIIFYYFHSPTDISASFVMIFTLFLPSFRGRLKRLRVPMCLGNGKRKFDVNLYP